MKVAIGVTYSGAGMEGWQSQPSGNTVQDHLSRALSEIGGEPITVTGAGRTDAGVHASAQVAHFETSVERPESAWVRRAMGDSGTRGFSRALLGTLAELPLCSVQPPGAAGAARGAHGVVSHAARPGEDAQSRRLPDRRA